MLVVTRLVIFHDKRNKTAFLKELAYTRGSRFRQSFWRRSHRQLVLRSCQRFRLCSKKCLVAGTFGNFRKCLKEPRVQRRNLFKRLHKQATASIGIGQSAVGSAAFNFEFLHKRIEAVVRNILERNARKRKRIPEHMGIIRNTDLGKRLLEELGIEKGIVSHNREVTDKRANLPSNRCKIRSTFQVRLVNAGQRLNKGTEFSRRRLH